MGFICNVCHRQSTTQNPLVVKLKCPCCGSFWAACENHLDDLVTPTITEVSGCTNCRPTMAKVDFDCYRETHPEGGVAGEFSIDLRKDTDALKEMISEKMEACFEIGWLEIMVVGTKGNFLLGGFGPINIENVGLKEPWDPYKSDELGNGLHYRSGYILRILTSSSRIIDKEKWEFETPTKKPTIPKKYVYWEGLSIDNFLELIIDSARHLHDNGKYLPNEKWWGPYPIIVHAQEHSTEEWDDSFQNCWVCLKCNVKNPANESKCSACNTELLYKKIPMRKRPYIPKEVKKEVFERDKGRCVICGSDKDIEYDHIIPFSKGGSSTVNNLQILCKEHNRTKGNKIE